MTALRSARWCSRVSTLLCALLTIPAAAQLAGPKPAAALVAPTLNLSATSGYFVTPNYIRTGQPITFSARALPADASGTLTFFVDGVPVQTTTLAPQTPGDYIAIGDSITYAAYIGDPTQRYPAIVGSTLNLNTSSFASPGYTACDALYDNVIPNNVGISTTANPLFSLMIGANDYNLYGNGAHEAVFNLCDQAAITWLGVSRQNKVLIGDPDVSVVSGSWTAADAPMSSSIETLNPVSSSGGSGGHVRFTLTTSGAAAYLWYGIQTASTGSFTVSIDGGTSSAPIQTQFDGSAEILPASYALLRLPVAAGAHTFDIAAQSGTVTLLGMGSAPAPGTQTIPTVLVTDIPYGLNTNNATAEYTSDIQANVALLQADGLDLRFVPTHQYMFGTPVEMMDPRHPNALGLSELAQALLAAITTASPAADTIPVAAATYTTSALTAGSHQIAVSYSGDTNYAPASTSINGFVLYDATSSTTLSASGSLFPIQTPITFTAAVGNATGLMNFVDTGSGSNVLLGSAWLDGAPSVSITVPSLSAGQHTIVAQFQGDIFNAPSSSAPLTVTVLGPYTSTSLASPATRYYAAVPVALTASVAPALATGSVTFLDGANALGQSTLVSGAATFTTSSLAPGVHAVTAGYGGNATQNSSTSPALSIEIDPNPTVVSISPLTATLPYGTPIALTVNVSPSSASGTVALSDSFVALGQVSAVIQSIPLPALNNGAASVVTSTLAPGTHTFTVIYSGDTNDLPAISSSVGTHVTLAASSTSLAALPHSLIYGNSLTLAASVTPPASTGSVTFADSVSGTLAQIPLVNGAAAYSTSTLTPGPHTFTAAYAGDSFRTSSISPAISATIAPVASSVALTAPASTVYAGNPLPLTATLTPTVATGTVLFRDATLGVLGQSPVVKGIATLTLSNPSLGTYNITASYSGDLDDTPSASAVATAQIVLTPTATALAASANPSAFGSPVTIAASVSPSSATGSVVFMDGTSTLGTALVAAGKASFSTATFSVGTHSLRAIYSGDALNASSTSATIAETIAASATSTSLTLAQNNVTANSSATVNIRVASTNTTPSGAVTLRSGSTVLASAPLANAAIGAGYATLSFNAATLGLGAFPLVASYSGDNDDLPSGSSAAAAALVVSGIPTTVTLSLSVAQIAIAGSINLNATVASAAGTPTGSIAFTSNGKTLGTATLTPAGTASVSLTATSVAAFPVTAAYTPTGLYATSVSAPQTFVVTPPLSVAISPATMQAGPGTSAAASLTLTPLSGFSGAIQTTCSASVSFVQCSLAAPSTIGGSAPLSVPVQIIIAKSSAALSHPTGTVFALLLPALLALRSRRHLVRHLRTLSAISLLAGVSCAICGCAEGGDFNSIPPGTQTVTFTVTAAGMPVSTTLTVNIAD